MDDILETELEDEKLGNGGLRMFTQTSVSPPTMCRGYKSTSNARNCKLNLRLQTATKNSPQLRTQ